MMDDFILRIGRDSRSEERMGIEYVEKGASTHRE